MKLKFTNMLAVTVTGFLFNINIAAQGPIITTVAGNGFGTGTGMGGFSGDGGPATAAKLFAPAGVALDAAGNIYFADSYNNRVRKVAVATGIITTVAGNGFGAGTGITGGYTGDGGLADSAELFTPTSVAVDAAGNIYICDYSNNVIRKVNANTHIITTVAGSHNQGYTGDGGQATAAELDQPEGIALDIHDNIYIADWGNNVVRKVTASTGVITTVAGNGTGHGFGGGSGDHTGDGGPADSATLNGPSGVAVDASGTFYIADQSNSVIRKVDGTTQIITTISGIAFFPSFSGDGGPADSAGLSAPAAVGLDVFGNLYIADEANYRVRRINLSTHIITTVAGNGITGFSGDGGIPTSAELDGPTSIATDATGNFYFTDSQNERVRKISLHATGIDEVMLNADITVYPVPTSATLTVKLNGSGYSMMRICDELGREIYAQTLSTTQYDLSQQINLNNASNGIYILQIGTSNEVLSRRVLVQK